MVELRNLLYDWMLYFYYYYYYYLSLYFLLHCPRVNVIAKVEHNNVFTFNGSDQPH